MMRFAGRHVVITGGSSGIGRATGERIAAEGGTVTLIARRANVLQDVCAAIGPGAGFIAADVGDQPAIVSAMDEAIARNGPIDGLFLNAAAEGMYATTPDYTDEAFEAAMRVNVFSPFWTLRHVLPAMTARRSGAILVTGTLGAVRGMAGTTGYCVSQHAVLGLARMVAMEAAPHNVRCNVLHPGFIDTPMLAGAPDEAKAHMAAITPQRRVGKVEEAAAVAAFLLSDDASHVTAQDLAVDGGLLGTLAL
jgi:NAD(P)-dependent dehydrogenase (short-subunit alcohol dehydrogenase family)